MVVLILKENDGIIVFIVVNEICISFVRRKSIEYGEINISHKLDLHACEIQVG